MTHEEKELLIKDLCSRLPYGVKVQCGDYLFTFDKDHMGIGLLYTDFNGNPLESPKIILSGCYYGENIKPYLFPLSSMTVKQRDSYRFLTSSAHASPAGLIDFFHKNHIDYRGLIPKGLAKDATGLNIY